LEKTFERLHFTLKSGHGPPLRMNVEKRQFYYVQTTINALLFYLVVAWQLLAITYVLRENQQAPS